MIKTFEEIAELTIELRTNKFLNEETKKDLLISKNEILDKSL